jgi:hypothetical protein
MTENYLKVSVEKLAAKTVYTMLNAVTTNQTSVSQSLGSGRRTIKTSIAGTGAVSATVTFYGNDVDSTATMIALTDPILLSGSGADYAGADLPAEWPYMWAKVENITGTGAAVTATVSI